MINVGFNIKFFMVFLVAIVFGFVVVVHVYSQSNQVTSQTVENTDTILASNGTATDLGGTISGMTATTSELAWVEFNGNDGNEDLVNVTSWVGSDIGATAFSVSMWINIKTWDNIIGNEIVGIHCNPPATCPDRGWVLTTVGIPMRVDFVINNGTASDINADTAVLDLNTWYHLTAVYNGTIGTMYLNGVENQSSIADIPGGVDNASRALFIGNGFGSLTDEYNGSIDELRIYNKSLSLAEINEIYDSGREPNQSLPTDELRLWMSFNENQGSTVFDKSGNLHDGIIIGTVDYMTSGSTTLVEDTDFSISGSEFTIINNDYGYSQIAATFGLPTSDFSSSRTIIQLAGILLILAILAIIWVKIREDIP